MRRVEGFRARLTRRKPKKGPWSALVFEAGLTKDRGKHLAGALIWVKP